MTIDRRTFIQKAIFGTSLLSLFPSKLFGASTCNVAHPFLPPRMEFSGICHNCGMRHSMWARTWHTYELDNQKLDVCSMHCLAESTMNSETTPENVQVAIYLSPGKTIPADKAFYVIGSKARGTMAIKSKLAFATEQEAKNFAGECGGVVVNYHQAYHAAAKALEAENEMLYRNRIEQGKIVEPIDNKDKCAVCKMYPARFPQNKCQLQTTEGEVVHFCSTQCLFEYLNNSPKYGKTELDIKLIWVIDFDSGQWIYAENGFYVLGTKLSGPMGKEAYPFFNLEHARRFSRANRGTVLRFKEVTIAKIMN